MATDIENKNVKEAKAVIYDKGCSTSDTVQRKKKLFYEHFSVCKEEKI